MKRLKRKRFKRQKDLLVYCIKNILNRKPTPVVKKKPEKPSKINWKWFWQSRGIQND